MTEIAESMWRRLDLFSETQACWIWRVLVVWFAAWSLVGLFVVGFSLNIPGGSIPDMLFMLLASGILFMESIRQRGFGTSMVAFAWVAGVSGIVEGVGAKTGIPFGPYFYTDAFGWRLFGILPVTIPLAWWVVVLPLFHLAASRLRRGGAAAWLFISVAVASSAVWIDLLLEPVAWLVRGYWIWESGGPYYGVPSQNFLGWFMTAFLITLGLCAIFGKAPVREPVHPPWGPWGQGVLAVVILTFVLSAMVNGHSMAGFIGLAFLVFQGLSLRSLGRVAVSEKEKPETSKKSKG